MPYAVNMELICSRNNTVNNLIYFYEENFTLSCDDGACHINDIRPDA